MMATNDVENEEEELVRCTLCANHVWVRKDRLEKHVQKVHSPTAAARKSFTTYTANLASSLPAKVAAPAALPGNVTLISRRGQRAGAGRCAECGQEAANLWHYPESNRGAVDICGLCKPTVFDRSFG